MYRLVLLLGALSLTTVTPVAAPAVAAPATSPDHGMLEFCRTVGVPTYPDLTLGNCLASRTTFTVGAYQGWSEHVCFFYENELPDEFYAAYETYSECVVDKASQI